MIKNKLIKIFLLIMTTWISINLVYAAPTTSDSSLLAPNTIYAINVYCMEVKINDKKIVSPTDYKQLVLSNLTWPQGQTVKFKDSLPSTATCSTSDSPFLKSFSIRSTLTSISDGANFALQIKIECAKALLTKPVEIIYGWKTHSDCVNQ